MKKVLYIGQYTDGTTSRMRAEILIDLLEADVQIIDIHQPFFRASRIVRSIGFRLKTGPLISQINNFIIEQLESHYDLVWVDKAVFLTLKTIQILRGKTGKLVHFTPDPSFTYHHSKLFNASIKYFDFLITTKSYEVKHYEKLTDSDKVILITQGFNKNLHRPYNSFEEKKDGVVFIGHHEKYRERIIQYLIDNSIHVAIAGIKWKPFSLKNRGNKYLSYLGSNIAGENYAKTISNYHFSLGFISKWIPELHTTRTFEIPACGTGLITESNWETRSFFNDDEVIFYSDEVELMKKIKYFQKNLDELDLIIQKGSKKVNEGCYDYHSILTKVLKQVR
jgi:spore maturation protein CgeB